MGQISDPAVPPPTTDHINDSKPPTRLPSRPLSSTTTTTNATVLPPTPTQIRRPRKYPPVPDPPIQPLPIDSTPSRPSTPKPSNTRKKLHDLFGIPLPNSRKSSLSRPDSPERFQDAPPLPRTFAGLNFTSNTNGDSKQSSHLTHHPPRSSSRHQSPSRPSENIPTKSKTRAFGSSRLDFFRAPRFFSGSGVQKSNSTKRFASSPSRLPTSDPPTTVEQSAPLRPSISAPTAISRLPSLSSRQDSLSSRQSTDPNNLVLKDEQADPMPVLANTAITSSTVAPTAQDYPTTLIPKIIQTPPTPAKSIPSPIALRRNSSELKRRQRPLAVVGEENLLRESEKDRGRQLEREGREGREWGKWSQRLPSPKFFGVKDAKDKVTEKEGERHLPRGRVIIAITHNSNKEQDRPITGELARQTPSRGNGTRSVMRNTSLVGNGRTKHGSFDFEKPVWSGGGRAGSSIARSGYSRSGDSLQSGTSNGTHSTKHVETNGSSSSRKPQEDGSSYHRTPASSSNHLSPPPSASSHATSHSAATHTRPCSVSAPTPATSGLSSSLGRSTSRRTVRTTNITLGGLSHGPFSFERPVPPPAPTETSMQLDRSIRDYRLPEKSDIFSHKVGRKGRSLDLGLGLAWAPTKVKEEALMSSGRTLSRETSMHNTFNAQNKAPMGSDLTNVFREVLSEAGFAKFKKCLFPLPVKSPAFIC